MKGFKHEWSPKERARCFVTERESTGPLEFIAMEYWFEHFGSSCANLRLELDTDNRQCMLAIEAAYSPTARLMPSIKTIRMACVTHGIVLRVRHIIGMHFNLVADHLSHNRITEAICRADLEFGLPLLML